MKNTTSLFAATIILASVLPASSATVIHSWDFEGDFLDDVGAAEGSLTGSTTVGTTTGHGGGTAALFQHSVSGPAGSGGVLGTNGTVNLAHTAGSPTIATPISGFSMSWWFKIADDGLTGTAGNRGFFDFSANGTDSGVQSIYLGAGQINFRADNGNGTANVIFLSQVVAVEDNQWHQVAVTFTPGLTTSGFLAYLDGVALTNQNAANGNTTGFATGDLDAQDNPYLGSYNFGGTTENKGLNGALDDVQIWSGVLTPSEVAALAVPEPASAMLGALGLLATLRRRRP